MSKPREDEQSGDGKRRSKQPERNCGSIDAASACVKEDEDDEEDGVDDECGGDVRRW